MGGATHSLNSHLSVDPKSRASRCRTMAFRWRRMIICRTGKPDYRRSLLDSWDISSGPAISSRPRFCPNFAGQNTLITTADTGECRPWTSATPTTPFASGKPTNSTSGIETWTSLFWTISETDDKNASCIGNPITTSNAERNWQMKHGDMGINATALNAYYKQKHRMVYERRHGPVGYGRKPPSQWKKEWEPSMHSTNFQHPEGTP